MGTNRKHKLRRVLGTAVAIALVAAACGDDDDDSSDTDAPAETDAADADDGGQETDDTEAPAETEAAGDEEAAAGGGEGIRLGILGECEGGFAAFSEDVVAGATLAMINKAGATSNSSTTAMDGFSGASIDGVDIELVGIGCGDDTADRAIQEIRTLVGRAACGVGRSRITHAEAARLWPFLGQSLLDCLSNERSHGLALLGGADADPLQKLFGQRDGGALHEIMMPCMISPRHFAAGALSNVAGSLDQGDGELGRSGRALSQPPRTLLHAGFARPFRCT